MIFSRNGYSQTESISERHKVPATGNMTGEEKRALQNLKKAEDVTIVPAKYKGKAIVVMAKSEYEQKCLFC